MRSYINPLDSQAISDRSQGVDISTVSPPQDLQYRRQEGPAQEPQDQGSPDQFQTTSTVGTPATFASQQGGGKPNPFRTAQHSGGRMQCDQNGCRIVQDQPIQSYTVQGSPVVSEGVPAMPGFEQSLADTLNQVASDGDITNDDMIRTLASGLEGAARSRQRAGGIIDQRYHQGNIAAFAPGLQQAVMAKAALDRQAAKDAFAEAMARRQMAMAEKQQEEAIKTSRINNVIAYEGTVSGSDDTFDKIVIGATSQVHKKPDVRGKFVADHALRLRTRGREGSVTQEDIKQYNLDRHVYTGVAFAHDISQSAKRAMLAGANPFPSGAEQARASTSVNMFLIRYGSHYDSETQKYSRATPEQALMNAELELLPHLHKTYMDVAQARKGAEPLSEQEIYGEEMRAKATIEGLVSNAYKPLYETEQQQNQANRFNFFGERPQSPLQSPVPAGGVMEYQDQGSPSRGALLNSPRFNKMVE